MDQLALQDMDRDGAVAEALDGLTRRSVLRAAAVGTAGTAALAGLGPATAGAASNKLDLTILQFALVLERLGAAFYDEAVEGGKLKGETLAFAKTVRAHEIAHVKVVANTIRALGGQANPAPTFDFGGVTANEKRFQKAAASLEEVCVEALNGAGPLVSKQVLAGAGGLVSVEARHVAWIRAIIGATPAQRPFDRALTAKQAEKRVKATGFIKSGI